MTPTFLIWVRDAGKIVNLHFEEGALDDVRQAMNVPETSYFTRALAARWTHLGWGDRDYWDYLARCERNLRDGTLPR